jgi:hypothetical protein
VIHDVVDAAREAPVDGRADVGERREEVLGEPGGGLGRGQPPAGDVGGGGRPLHRVGAHALRLRDVARGKEVEDAGRRAGGLVPHDLPAPVRPPPPLAREAVEEKVRDRLAVVHEQARAPVGAVRTEEGRQLAPQVVAAPPFELVEEGRRPVGLPVGVVHLVGVVEERAQAVEGPAGERVVEAAQVAPDGRGGEVVDHVALAAGGRALHELAVVSEEERVQCPRPPAPTRFVRSSTPPSSE